MMKLVLRLRQVSGLVLEREPSALASEGPSALHIGKAMCTASLLVYIGLASLVRTPHVLQLSVCSGSQQTLDLLVLGRPVARNLSSSILWRVQYCFRTLSTFGVNLAALPLAMTGDVSLTKPF